MSRRDHVADAAGLRGNLLKRIKPNSWKRAVVGDHIMWTHQAAGRTLVRVKGGEVPTDIPQDPNELVEYHLVRRAEAFDLLLGRHGDLAHVGEGEDDRRFVGQCIKAFRYAKAHHKSIWEGGKEEYETGDHSILPPLPNHEDELERVKLIYEPDSDTRRVTRRGTKGNGNPGDTPTLTGKRGRSGHPVTPDEPESQSKKQSRERHRSPSPPVALITGDKSLDVVDALVATVASDPGPPNAPSSDNCLFDGALNNFVSDNDQLKLEVAELKRKAEISDQLKLKVAGLSDTVTELVEVVKKLKEQQEGGNLPAPPTGVSPAAGVAIDASNMPEFLVKALEKQNTEGKPMKYQSGQSSVNGVRIAVNFDNSVGTSLYLNIQEKLGSDGRCQLNYAVFKNEEEQVELRVDKKKLQWSYKLNLAASKFDILRDILAGKLYDFHVDKLKKSMPRAISVPVVANNDAVPTPRTKKILSHLGRMLGVSTGTPVGPSPLRPNEVRSKNMPPPPTRTQSPPTRTRSTGVRRSPRGHPQVGASEFGGFVSQTGSPYANTRRRASIGGTPGVFTFIR